VDQERHPDRGQEQDSNQESHEKELVAMLRATGLGEVLR
jgi:hypothetical protein